MDMQMPADGWLYGHRMLRQMGCHVPNHRVNSSCHEGGFAKVLTRAATINLSKPIRREGLIEMIHEYML